MNQKSQTKNYIFIFIILIGIFIFHSASAEDLKALAYEICHAYLEHPQDFVDVKMEKCERPMPNANYYYDGSTIDCFRYTDSLSQITYLYGMSESTGTCHGSGIYLIDDGNTIKEIPIQNSNVNGYGFGSSEKALIYKNHLLFMQISNSPRRPRQGDLRLVQGDKQTVLCNFKLQIKGWNPPEPKDNLLCQKFADREYTIESESISQQDRHKWPKYPEGSPTAKFTADLDRDGEQEEILKYDFASGAGCGAAGTPLVVLKNNEAYWQLRGRKSYEGQLPPDLEKFAIALNDLTRYSHDGNSWFVVTIDDKDYLLADYFERRKDMLLSFPSLRNSELNRELYIYKSGSFERVCQQKSYSDRVISHEAIPKKDWDYRLSYIPLE